MSKAQISQRYAKALFELVKQANAVSETRVVLNEIGHLINSLNELKQFINNPLMTLENRNQILYSVFGQRVPKRVQTFLLFVSFKNRLSALPEMIEAFDQLCLESNNQTRALVETIYPLDEEQKSNILRHLAGVYQKAVVANWKIRQDMLGGFRMQVQGRLYDYSFKSQLDRFQQKIEAQHI